MGYGGAVIQISLI